MAYINQDEKKVIAANLKNVIPASWKYSLSIENHSKIVCTIKSAPIDLIAACKNKHSSVKDHLDVNTYYLDNAFDGDVLSIMQNIKKELNLNNYDNSDSQTDYFDVGHYIAIQIGKWNVPFQVK